MNKKLNRWKIYRQLTLLMLFLGFCANLTLITKLNQSLPYINLYIEQEGNRLNGRQAKEILEQNAKLESAYSVVIWGKKMKEPISSKELSKCIEGNILALQGDSQLLFPNSRSLGVSNEGECLISTALANKLFGNTNVTNLPIVYNKKSYEILSVIPSKEPFLIYQVNAKETIGLNRLTILSKEKVNKAVLTQQFAKVFSVEAQLLDYELFIIILVGMNLFLLVMLLCLIIWKMFILIQQPFQQKRERNELIIKGAQFLLLLNLLVLFYHRFYISSEYLPTELSDFNFFNIQKDKFIENIKLLLQTEKYSAEFLLLKNLFSAYLITIFVLPITFLIDKMFAHSIARWENKEDLELDSLLDPTIFSSDKFYKLFKK